MLSLHTWKPQGDANEDFGDGKDDDGEQTYGPTDQERSRMGWGLAEELRSRHEILLNNTQVPFRLEEWGRGRWEESEGVEARARTMHDWTFDEVRTFLDERPLSQYLNILEIVDGRVLWVLTDEMLQELGLAKKLHRLVLIKKIAKEKSRSQQHENLHLALASLIRHHLSRDIGDIEVKGGGEDRGEGGGEGEGEGEDAFRSRAEEMEKHCRDIMACMTPSQLQAELLAKLNAGGWMCEAMLYNFGKSYQPVAGKEVMRMMPGMISGGGGGSGGGGDSGSGSGVGCEGGREGRRGDSGVSTVQMASQAMRVTLLMLNNEENRGSLNECAGIMEAVVSRMQACEGDEEIQVLGLAIMLTLCYSADNIDELVRQGAIKRAEAAMRTHEKHHVVCDYGVGLYWLFAFDRRTHDMMAACGGIKALVASMITCKAYSEMAELACGLMCSLCTTARNKEVVKKEGGISAVVKAMVEHSDHEGIQSEGSLALKMMSAHGAGDASKKPEG